MNYTVRVELHGVKHDSEKYTELHDEMEKEGFTRYLNIDNMSYHLPTAEYSRVSTVDNGMNFIDNVDVVAARDPSEITPKNFLREYAGFVAQAVKDDFLRPDQGFDTRKVDIRSEGRAVAGSLR